MIHDAHSTFVNSSGVSNFRRPMLTSSLFCPNFFRMITHVMTQSMSLMASRKSLLSFYGYHGRVPKVGTPVGGSLVYLLSGELVTLTFFFHFVSDNRE